MIVLVGESCSGKSTVAKELVKLGYENIVTYTTRPKRDNEIDGVDYHFVTEDEFNKLTTSSFFLETANYRGWRYGSAKKDYTPNKIVVLTPSGLRKLKSNHLIFRSFYICISRRDRLIKSLQRGGSIDESIRRDLVDVGAFDGIENEVDYVINNNGYKHTPEQLALMIDLIYYERR